MDEILQQAAENEETVADYGNGAVTAAALLWTVAPLA